jgi:hypothetical protein
VNTVCCGGVAALRVWRRVAMAGIALFGQRRYVQGAFEQSEKKTSRAVYFSDSMYEHCTNG